jgi:hypothetical protein
MLARRPTPATGYGERHLSGAGTVAWLGHVAVESLSHSRSPDSTPRLSESPAADDRPQRVETWRWTVQRTRQRQQKSAGACSVAKHACRGCTVCSPCASRTACPESAWTQARSARICLGRRSVGSCRPGSDPAGTVQYVSSSHYRTGCPHGSRGYRKQITGTRTRLQDSPLCWCSSQCTATWPSKLSANGLG